MAAINFEALTILGGEFLEFNELGDYTSIVVNESNVGGGFHLEARGSGDQLWCSYDDDEFHLKLGRISMMDKGDEFSVSHNNFYGYDEEILVLEKEAPGQTPEELVEIIVSWTRYYDFTYKDEEEFGSIEKYISIRIPQRLIEEYQKWYSFRKMWNQLESEIIAKKFAIEVEDIE